MKTAVLAVAAFLSMPLVSAAFAQSETETPPPPPPPSGTLMPDDQQMSPPARPPIFPRPQSGAGHDCRSSPATS